MEISCLCCCFMVFLYPQPLPYPTFPVEFHHGEDAEGDGNGGFQGDETRLEGIGELVGDDVVTGPKDTRTWHQRENAADEEHRNGTFAPCRL